MLFISVEKECFFLLTENKLAEFVFAFVY